jgi:uncharacterized membrane protein
MNEKGVRLAVFFVLGMIMGSVFVSIYIGRQIDHLTQENEVLLRQQEQLQDELNHLKESMGEREKEVVSSIETHIAITGGSLTRLEENAVILAIDKQVQQWLEPLKGQEVKKLNHLLIPQIIDNRTVEVAGTSYRLSVKLVVSGPELVFYLEAKMEKGARPVDARGQA